MFYLDGNGGGLVVSEIEIGIDNPSTIPTILVAEWGCPGTVITNASGSAIGTGQQNTTSILSECSQANIAAAHCDNLTLNGYSDWFLPSEDELIEIKNSGAVSYFSSPGNPAFAHSYWSSTQAANPNLAKIVLITFGSAQPQFSPKGNEYKVRAIRAF